MARGQRHVLVLSVDTAGPGVVDSPDRLVSGRLAVATWAIAASPSAPAFVSPRSGFARLLG